MEIPKTSTYAPCGSKILIDRDRIWKNTIYINPRILKSAATGFLPREKGPASVPLVAPQSELCNQQQPSFHRQAFNRTSESTSSKCVYLNPHFQRTVPSRVHINPKKFSGVIESSNNSLYVTETQNTKVRENIKMSNSAILESENSLQTLPSRTKTCGSQSESHYTKNTNNYSWLPSNSQLECVGRDRVVSTKLVNNLVEKETEYSNNLIKISDTKLVRMTDKSKSWTVNKSLQKTLVSQTNQIPKKSHFQDSKSVRRKSEKQKTSHAVSQQNAISPPLLGRHKFTSTQENKGSPSRYKIDRRLVKSRLSKSYKKVSPRNENTAVTTHRRNIVQRRNSLSSFLYRSKHFSVARSIRSNDRMKIVLTSRKLLRIGSTAKSKEMKSKKAPTSHTTRLVRIGGVLYKTSRNKLTKSRSPETNTKSPVVKRLKMERSRIIYIRGNKFIMDAKGKTLKQISQKPANNCERGSKSLSIKRIDIGGVTFVKKSSDVLVRTNSHTARNIVNHAKNKSIAMLTNKLRKINQPCAFYRKFGKCPRREKGTCQLVHDPKQVSLCKRFLQGECNIEKCLLSHQIVPEKMPTCKYFLEGCCVREDCPYLHVKLNSKAEICERFLQGFCAEGSTCKKRHSYICPDFEKLGTCQKGKYCPYPHKTGVKCNKKNALNQVKQMKIDNALGDQMRKRYYQDDKNDISRTPESQILEKTLKLSRAESNTGNLEEAETQQMETPVKRPKIGRLPSYIALSH